METPDRVHVAAKSNMAFFIVFIGWLFDCKFYKKKVDIQDWDKKSPSE